MCDAAAKESDETVYELHQLLGELTGETLRRLERAQEALEIVWEWEEKVKPASPTQDKGRF